VVAPVLIGFGRSDKPIRSGDYGVLAHRRWLDRFLDAHSLERITLVVHDFAGLVALPLAANDPERFSRLALLDTSLNTGEEKRRGVATRRYWAAFAAWRAYTRHSPGFRPGAIVSRQVRASLPQDVIAAYDAPFPSESDRVGLRVNDSLYPLRPSDEGAAESRDAQIRFARWTKPVLLAFSQTASRFHPGQWDAFRELFAKAPLRAERILESGHFIPEDQPKRLADLLLALLDT
jgi:haloalkane dehalogenase